MEVIQEVRDQALKNGTRYFSFGIGPGVSSALVKGIAEAGNGEAVFIANTNERMSTKIMQQMNKALSAPLTGATIDWKSLHLDQEPSPKRLPPLFPDTCVFVFATVAPASLPVATDGLPITLTLKAKTPDGEFTYVRTVEQITLLGLQRDYCVMFILFLVCQQPITVAFAETNAVIGPLLSALAARSRLKDLETIVTEEKHEETRCKLKAEAVKLSKSSNVLCTYTSFVAVHERGDPVTGTMKRFDIPLQIIKAVRHEALMGVPQIAPASCHRMLRSAPGIVFYSSAPAMALPSSAPKAKKLSLPGNALGGAMAAVSRGVHSIGTTLFERGGEHVSSSSAPQAFTGASDLCLKAVDAESETQALSGGGGFSSQVALPTSFSSPLPPPQSSPMGFAPPQQPSMKSPEHVVLVNSQKASGTWEMSETIMRLARAAFPGFSGNERGLSSGPFSNAAVWVTVVVLLLLQVQYKDYEEEWKPVARKSKRWLAKTVPELKIGELLQQANAILSGN